MDFIWLIAIIATITAGVCAMTWAYETSTVISEEEYWG